MAAASLQLLYFRGTTRQMQEANANKQREKETAPPMPVADQLTHREPSRLSRPVQPPPAPAVSVPPQQPSRVDLPPVDGYGFPHSYVSPAPNYYPAVGSAMHAAGFNHDLLRHLLPPSNYYGMPPAPQPTWGFAPGPALLPGAYRSPLYDAYNHYALQNPRDSEMAACVICFILLRDDIVGLC